MRDLGSTASGEHVEIKKIQEVTSHKIQEVISSVKAFAEKKKQLRKKAEMSRKAAKVTEIMQQDIDHGHIQGTEEKAKRCIAVFGSFLM